jgi:hypothetical protein
MAAADCIHRILTEDVISSSEAQRELRQVLNTTLDRSTIHRWMLRGVKGVQLDHVRLGGKLLTSKQAITRFVSELTAKDSQQ